MTKCICIEHANGSPVPNRECPIHFGEWAACCRASNRLADLVCMLYHPKDKLARKTWPTATWAEIIAQELGIQIPEESE